MFNVQAYLADKSKTWELSMNGFKHYDTLSVISLDCTGSGTRKQRTICLRATASRSLTLPPALVLSHSPS